MKKALILFSILVVIATIVFDNYKGVALAANQGDLCGGTRGNGQIINIGSSSFTLQHNDGRDRIVNLTDQATIKTLTGFVSLSDLKIGDRVTLVGDDNYDGSFTADAIVVCSSNLAGVQENGTSQAHPIIVRNNDANYERVNGVINTATYLLVGLIWLGIALFLKLKKRKSFVYLLFFTIFYIYLYKVLDYTLLQFQSLLLL